MNKDSERESSKIRVTNCIHFIRNLIIQKGFIVVKVFNNIYKLI